MCAHSILKHVPQTPLALSKEAWLIYLMHCTQRPPWISDPDISDNSPVFPSILIINSLPHATDGMKCYQGLVYTNVDHVYTVQGPYTKKINL